MAKIPDYLWERVPDGWYGFDIPDEQELIDIIVEFHEKFVKLVPDYEILQIKEKVWELRIYVGRLNGESWNDEADALLMEYERKGSLWMKKYYDKFFENILDNNDRGC